MITGEGKLKYSEKKILSLCHFVYHKIHIDYTKVETGSSRVDAGE